MAQQTILEDAAHTYLATFKNKLLDAYAVHQLTLPCPCSYIKASLGGPTPAEYETLRAERDALASDLALAQQTIAELQAKVSRCHQHLHPHSA